MENEIKKKKYNLLNSDYEVDSPMGLSPELMQLAASFANPNREPAGKSSVNSTSTKTVKKIGAPIQPIPKQETPILNESQGNIKKISDEIRTGSYRLPPPDLSVIDYTPDYDALSSEYGAELAQLQTAGQPRVKTSDDYIKEALLAFGPLLVGTLARGNQGGAAGGQIGSDSVNKMLTNDQQQQKLQQTLSAYKQRGLGDQYDIKLKGLAGKEAAQKEANSNKIKVNETLNKMSLDDRKIAIQAEIDRAKLEADNAKTDLDRQKANANVAHLTKQLEETKKYHQDSIGNDRAKISQGNKKELTPIEGKRVTDLRKALAALDKLDSEIEKNKDKFAPESGVLAAMKKGVKSWVPNSEENILSTQFENAGQQVGKFLEEGKMTDNDLEFWLKQSPKVSNSYKKNKTGTKTMRERIVSAIKEEDKTFKQRGIDTSSFNLGSIKNNPEPKEPDINLIIQKQKQKKPLSLDEKKFLFEYLKSKEGKQ